MSSGGDKTEKATPKKREEARKKGQVARSADLNGSIVLLAGLAVLALTGPMILDRLATSMRETLMLVATPGVVTADGLDDLLGAVGMTTALTVGPIAFACLVAGVITSVAQVKWKPSAEAIKPDPKKLNPISGAKNIFGQNALVELVKSILKISAVAAIVAAAVLPDLDELAALVGMPPAQLAAELARRILAIAFRATAAYLVLAVADFFWQRYRTEKQLRMSKEDVKQEHKNQELPPEVRGALRRRQMQGARARMMDDVPQADVIVTNPTHYAVALRYSAEQPAPVVVAKGKDLLAARIREIAAAHDVPIVPDPPLARALHGTVEVGHMIPEELFQTVAQLLAFVYRTAAHRRALGGVA